MSENKNSGLELSWGLKIGCLGIGYVLLKLLVDYVLIKTGLERLDIWFVPLRIALLYFGWLLLNGDVKLVDGKLRFKPKSDMKSNSRDHDT